MLPRTHRHPRRLLLSMLACLGLAGLAPSAAEAASTVCLRDGAGNPLSRVWVQHWWTDYMTNGQGCVTIDTNGTFDLRVFAHNPVVRMDDGQNFTLPVSQEIKAVSHGQTRSVPAQGAFWRKAEQLRTAYNNGLREFRPWQTEFPAGTKREPSILDYAANDGVIRASWPDQSVAPLAWAEPAAQPNGFPLIHLKSDDPPETIAHELGHALHFSKLSRSKRESLQMSYLGFLATDDTGFHCFDDRTNATVAWIEAFGAFAAMYTAATDPFDDSTEAKRRAFFNTASRQRAVLLDNVSAPGCPQNPPGAMFGPDVEGAVFMALFHDFARSPEVGLPLVVETFVISQATTVLEYGAWIRNHYGADSRIYAALVCAGSKYGIVFPGGSFGLAGGAEPGDRFGGAVATGDFNGDGSPDMAVGAPGEAIGTVANAGMVSVIYGGAAGLGGMCNQAFTQDTEGVPGAVEAGDRFGSVLTTGDFNSDGFADLVVGIPDEDQGNELHAGSVLVIPGNHHGLDFQNLRAIYKTGPASKGGLPRGGDRFGASLVAGNFDGYAGDELAIGIPGQENATAIVGAVLLARSPLAEDNAANYRLLFQPGEAEANDRFGSSVAAGDFDKDGRDDLAVGAPGETIDGRWFAGAVTLFHGTLFGPLTPSSRYFVQGQGGLAGTAMQSDEFGNSLAFGDFNKDGHADLAIGVPGDDVGASGKAGAVAVIYGAPRAATTLRNQLWDQNSAGINESAELSDRFGRSLVAADFNGDGHDDLAVGAPSEDLPNAAGAGAVVVLAGGPARPGQFIEAVPPVFIPPRPAGLTGESDRLLLPPNVTAGMAFGSSLAAADFNRDGRADLVVASPLEDVGAEANVGAVRIFRGSSNLVIQPAANQVWRQDL